MDDRGLASEMSATLHHRLLKAWRSPLMRFLMVGAFTFAMPLALAALLREQLGLGDQIVFFVSSVLAIETNFLLSYFFTWRLAPDRSSFLSAFLRFHASKLLTVALGQLLFAALNLGLGFYTAYIATVVLMTAINFLLHKFWIFRNSSTVSRAERQS